MSAISDSVTLDAFRKWRRYCREDRALARLFRCEAGVTAARCTIDQWLLWLFDGKPVPMLGAQDPYGVRKAVVDCCQSGPKSAADLARLIGVSSTKAVNAAHDLCRAGKLEKTGKRGAYLYQSASHAAPPKVAIPDPFRISDSPQTKPSRITCALRAKRREEERKRGLYQRTGPDEHVPEGEFPAARS